ncbi:MAG: hypothetical protein J6X44_08605 [Thermoguttaceae bacterium]|nr:hypothetical protein [Thermoguttaceae bacterium]
MGAFSNFFTQDSSNLELFPNYETIARLALSQERNLSDQIASDVRQAFFSEFDEFFKREWGQLLGAELDSVQFVRYGFASSDLSQVLEERGTKPLECALLSSHDASVKFCVVAPASTFQLVLDSWLGFDVAQLCRENVASKGRVFSEQTTRLEREILEFQTSRLGRLFPCLPVFNYWKARRLVALNEITAAAFDKNGYYWEQRAFEISQTRFSWFVVFPISALFERQEKDSFSSFLGINEDDRSFSVRVKPNAQPQNPSNVISDAAYAKADTIQDRRLANTGAKKIVSGTLKETDAQGRSTIDMVVEIGSGETSLELWNELRPGSFLTTELPANKLFVALFDGRPAYYVKPGVYRDVPAVQIKSKINA